MLEEDSFLYLTGTSSSASVAAQTSEVLSILAATLHPNHGIVLRDAVFIHL